MSIYPECSAWRHLFAYRLSELETNRCRWRQARENVRERVMIGLDFTSDWMKKWRGFSRPITKRKACNEKQKQMQITFDNQLKTVLMQQCGYIIFRWSHSRQANKPIKKPQNNHNYEALKRSYLNFLWSCRSENMTSLSKSLSSLSSTDGSSLCVLSFSHGHCKVFSRCSARIWERSWAVNAWL